MSVQVSGASELLLCHEEKALFCILECPQLLESLGSVMGLRLEHGQLALTLRHVLLELRLPLRLNCFGTNDQGLASEE